MPSSRSRWSGSGHHGQLCPEALGTDGGGDLLEQRDELGRRVGGEQPGEGGIELLRRRFEHLTGARDPGTHLSSGSDPLQPAYASTRIRVATSPGWWR